MKRHIIFPKNSTTALFEEKTLITLVWKPLPAQQQKNKTNSKEQLEKKIPNPMQVFTKSSAKIAINIT